MAIGDPNKGCAAPEANGDGTDTTSKELEMSTTTVTHQLDVKVFDDGQKIYSVAGRPLLAVTPMYHPDNEQPALALTLLDITNNGLDGQIDLGSIVIPCATSPEVAERRDQFIEVLGRIAVAAVNA